MLSYWPCQRLNVVMLAWQQQPLLPHFWHGVLTLVHRLASTAFSFSLSALFMLNRGLQIAGIVRCVEGSRR